MWSFKPAKYWQIELKTPIEQFPQCPWTGLNPCLGNQLISFFVTVSQNEGLGSRPTTRQRDLYQLLTAKKANNTSNSGNKRQLHNRGKTYELTCASALWHTPVLSTSRSAQLWLLCFATWDMNACFLCHSQDQRSSSRPFKTMQEISNTSHFTVYFIFIHIHSFAPP